MCTTFLLSTLMQQEYNIIEVKEFLFESCAHDMNISHLILKKLKFLCF